MELSAQNAFQVIFPKYVDLLTQSPLHTDQDLQTFIRDELPHKIQLVRSIEPTFVTFQTQFTNLILKRPKQQNLIQSLVLKASQKIEKYFYGLQVANDKQTSKNSLQNELSFLNLQQIRTNFREKLKSLSTVLKQKYFDNFQIERNVEEEVARRLYSLNEIYYFIKNDITSVAAKFRLKEHEILSQINKNSQNAQNTQQISDLIYLDGTFLEHIYQIVDKRCRPFLGKKDFFYSKVKQIQNESESKVPMNINLMVQSILGKQKYRVTKQLTSGLARELKTIDESIEQDLQKQCKDIIAQVDTLKKQFNQLKNNMFYLDIIRGSFGQKYKMELNKLENIYYLSNIEKYLQDVQTFTEKLIRVEEKIIQNRKQFMKKLGRGIQEKIVALVTQYQLKNGTYSQTLQEVIDSEFKFLEDSLYGILENAKPKNQSKNTSGDQIRRKRLEQAEDRRQELQYQREQKQRVRRKQLQDKAQQQRLKRQQDKMRLQQKRRADDQKVRKMREERDQKQKIRRLQQEEKQRVRKIEMEQKMKDKKLKDEQDKQRLKQQMRRKQQQKNRKDVDNTKLKQRLKTQKQEEQKRKKQQLEAKKRQIEEDKQRKQQQQRLEQTKLKRQKQQKERQQKQQREKTQQQRKIQQEKQRERKLQQQRQQKQKRDKKQKEQKQRQQKERKQLQRQKRERQQKLENQKRQRLEREQKERRQRQRMDNQRQSLLGREKQEEQQRQKARLMQLQKQKKQNQQKQQARILQAQKQRKQKQQKQRRQREDRQRRQREEMQQKQKTQRQLKEKKQRELKQQKQRKQRQARQLQQKQQKQARQLQQKQRRQQQQRQKLKLQKQQKQQQQRLQKQKDRKEKQRKQKQEKEKRQLDELLEQQENDKKNKSKVSDKNKKGGSGINYNDFDDIIDDDLDQIDHKQTKQTKKKVENLQDEYGDNYDDDFQSPQKDGQQGEQGQGQEQQPTGTQIQPQQLITAETLKCLNDYMKGSSYARKNKPNLEPFNNKESYIAVFEQFIQARKIYIFDAAVSQAVIDFSKQLQDQNAQQQDLKISIQQIKEEMFNDYASKIGQEEFDPRTILILPVSFQNQYDLKLIQFRPAHGWFRPVLGKQLEDQEAQEKFNLILEGLLHIFEIQKEPIIQPLVINEESSAVLATFDKQLPCLLVLFALHYETECKSDSISITQYTVERFFYTTQIIKPFYETIEQNQEELVKFYEAVMEKYENSEDITIMPLQIGSSDPQYEAKLHMHSVQIKENFLQNKKQKTLLLIFQILLEPEQTEQEEEAAAFEKITIYCSMQKSTAPKPAITYFIISKDDLQNQNASMLFDIISQGDDAFEVSVFMDYSRHNGLTQYSDWTLPLWARTIQKRKLSPVNAFRAIALAMSPYYIAYKEQD